MPQQFFSAQQLLQSNNVLHSSYIFQRQFILTFMRWVRHYFVLTRNGYFYLYSSHKSLKPQLICSLKAFHQIILDIKHKPNPTWAFHLIALDVHNIKSLVFSVPTEPEMYHLVFLLRDELIRINLPPPAAAATLTTVNSMTSPMTDTTRTQSQPAGEISHSATQQNSVTLFEPSAPPYTSFNQESIYGPGMQALRDIAISDLQASSCHTFFMENDVIQASANGEKTETEIHSQIQLNTTSVTQLGEMEETAYEEISGSGEPQRDDANSYSNIAKKQRYCNLIDLYNGDNASNADHADDEDGDNDDMKRSTTSNSHETAAQEDNVLRELPEENIYRSHNNVNNYIFEGNREDSLTKIRQFSDLGVYLIRKEMQSGRLVLTVICANSIIKYNIVTGNNSGDDVTNDKQLISLPTCSSPQNLNANNSAVRYSIEGQKDSFDSLDLLLFHYHEHSLPNRADKLSIPYRLAEKIKQRE